MRRMCRLPALSLRERFARRAAHRRGWPHNCSAAIESDRLLASSDLPSEGGHENFVAAAGENMLEAFRGPLHVGHHVVKSGITGAQNLGPVLPVDQHRQ